jgi:hypothetical protein
MLVLLAKIGHQKKREPVSEILIIITSPVNKLHYASHVLLVVVGTAQSRTMAALHVKLIETCATNLSSTASMPQAWYTLSQHYLDPFISCFIIIVMGCYDLPKHCDKLLPTGIRIDSIKNTI